MTQITAFSCSCHCFPSDSFIPQSSTAAPVCSNQEAAEKCQKAFHSAGSPVGAAPRVPALIRQQSNNSSGWSSQPWLPRYVSQPPGPPGAPSVTEALPAAPAETVMRRRVWAHPGLHPFIFCSVSLWLLCCSAPRRKVTFSLSHFLHFSSNKFLVLHR